METMYQSDFVARADAVTQKHLDHVNKATADLNAIMSGLGVQSQVMVQNVQSITPQSEPAAVNFVPEGDVARIFQDDYHGEFDALRDWFVTLRKEATEIFFPFVDAAGGDGADAWAQKAIAGMAIDLAEDAEFNRGRTRIYGEAFGKDPQFAEFYRSLDAYKASIGKKGDVLVIDPASSDFFKNMRVAPTRR